MDRKTCRFTDEQIEAIEAVVNRGEYASYNEAVRAAVREKFQEPDDAPERAEGRSLNGPRGWKGGRA